MRRAVPTVMLALAALLITACGRPPGTDGSLTDGWPAMPEPKVPVPVAPACYALDSADPTAVATWPPPVDCAVPHTVETALVGQFTGEDAERTSPPPIGGPGQRRAFQDCSGAVRDYLGGEWRAVRLELILITPSALHWDAGARWFRCDLVEYTDIENPAIKARTASLKGVLAGQSDLPLGCQQITESADKKTVQIAAAACTAPHNGEFAGLWEHPDGPYPEEPARNAAAGDGCRAVIAAFAGIPNDDNFKYRTGWVTSPFGRAAWERGNRAVRCFIWPGQPVTRSLKGAGPDVLRVE